MSEVELAALFDEWAKRYAADPTSFAPIVDEDGNPIETYGQSAARYFLLLQNELKSAVATAPPVAAS